MIKLSSNLLKLADAQAESLLTPAVGYGAAGTLLGGIGGLSLYHLLSSDDPKNRSALKYLLAGLTGSAAGGAAGAYGGPELHDAILESAAFADAHGTDPKKALESSKQRALEAQKALEAEKLPETEE
jgi:hypothetical protein